ncbi:MAG: terpene cyclase/mutase family protein [Oscillospiraceae bacterium]|nr:terpene cyclase/mutase family protein [Oscillospiraceae bacterium]
MKSMTYCAVYKVIAAASAAAMLFCALPAAAYTDVTEAVNGVYNYKVKGSDHGVSQANDWFAVAAGRGGKAMPGYLEQLSAYVAEKYQSDGGLDRNKATEWHRTALAVKALGGDPANVGGIDLLRDGITEPLVSLDRQGINGLIWAVIASKYCGILPPESVCARLAQRQNEDGSFSLRGAGDPDVTAMAICALSDVPGYENAVSAAKAALEAMRLPSGGFASSGAENCESTAQVIQALCALGEDPERDIAVLMSYRNPDGGFAHLPGGKSNDMASAQAMLALVTYEQLPRPAAAVEEPPLETTAEPVIAPAAAEQPGEEADLPVETAAQPGAEQRSEAEQNAEAEAEPEAEEPGIEENNAEAEEAGEMAPEPDEAPEADDEPETAEASRSPLFIAAIALVIAALIFVFIRKRKR